MVRMKRVIHTIVLFAAFALTACKNGAQKDISQKDKSDSVTAITDGQYAELDSSDVYNDSTQKGRFFLCTYS